MYLFGYGPFYILIEFGNRWKTELTNNYKIQTCYFNKKWSILRV